MTNGDEFITFRTPPREKFAVILAGGDGVRMREMTKKLAGCETPKQFCAILGDDTLMTTTRKRVSLKFGPAETFYCLTQTHERFYTPLLGDVHRKNKIIQPSNQGTAPAILYSLLRLSKRSPEAIVAFFPSDHYISDDQVFMDQVETAFRSVAKKPEAVILMGIEPVAPKSSYGWIEPCGDLADFSVAEIQKVKLFWEKPTTKQAVDLMAKGSLWNSFVMVGKVKSVLGLFRKYLPALYRLFCAGSITFGTPVERMTISTIYRMVASRNFSLDVLEKCADELYVLRCSGFAWSDLGEPREVLLKMAQLGLKNKLFPMAA